MATDLTGRRALAGRPDEARECLERIASLARQKLVDPHFLAWPHAAREDRDAAFAWLDRAHTEHSDRLAAVEVDPLLVGCGPIRGSMRCSSGSDCEDETCSSP